ncbi:hypothetical protein FA13DRAFT_1721318 [Coprinellus micaceus]|uniref:Uncharacterized protein n=1 Tax=Coprinellus micaceus TaxID=71717 RepID=A0A4Y7S269_COPMI|nr:hypothetical protein FA13DRAFT_1721318 [Coprinellus micaceus]
MNLQPNRGTRYPFEAIHRAEPVSYGREPTGKTSRSPLSARWLDHPCNRVTNNELGVGDTREIVGSARRSGAVEMFVVFGKWWLAWCRQGVQGVFGRRDVGGGGGRIRVLWKITAPKSAPWAEGKRPASKEGHPASMPGPPWSLRCSTFQERYPTVEDEGDEDGGAKDVDEE